MPVTAYGSLCRSRHLSVSKLEIISCVFYPSRGYLKRAAGNNFVNLLIPFIGVTVIFERRLKMFFRKRYAGFRHVPIFLPVADKFGAEENAFRFYPSFKVSNYAGYLDCRLKTFSSCIWNRIRSPGTFSASLQPIHLGNYLLPPLSFFSIFI